MSGWMDGLNKKILLDHVSYSRRIIKKLDLIVCIIFYENIGNYRIPKTAQTAPDGTRLDLSSYLPHHGIIRGNRDTTQCTWNQGWNAYKCSDMEHLMVIIESLDADTETRRLSPVAILGKFKN